MEVIVNGISLHFVRINERSEGPIVLFLHEGLGSIKQWKDFPDRLCQELGFEGLIYERQGYGQSSAITNKRDETYLHNYALEELPAFLQAVEPSRDLILFGHSDGGSISYIYAAHHPNRVKAIITEAAHVFVEEVTLEGIEPIVEEFKHGTLSSRLEKYHGDKTRQTFYAWADTWHLKKFKSWNIEACLPNILCPVLAIQGDDDEYGTVAQLDSIVSKTMGKADSILIPKCGHSPHKDSLEQVIHSCVKFVRSL